jgi:hypothetical protein
MVSVKVTSREIPTAVVVLFDGNPLQDVKVPPVTPL